MLLGSSLGITCLLALLLKASKSNPVPASPLWASLSNMVITAAMEGTAIGPAMVHTINSEANQLQLFLLGLVGSWGGLAWLTG